MPNSKGRVHFGKQDIGAEVLPILTTGLYRDPLDALREYIQNSIDAQSSHIHVTIDPDVVSVLDDGHGMSQHTARQAIRLGISDKNPSVHVGFRGIGIYSGFNLCDSLEVLTRSTAHPLASRLSFDFARIRSALLREQHRRAHGLPPELYLERLLEQSVFVETTPTVALGDHGTLVILKGLQPDVYSRLNSRPQIETYLQNVVPLPFNPAFKFGPIIQLKLDQADYRVVPLTLQLAGLEAQLYRPYTNDIFARGGQHPPAFFPIRANQERMGFAWVCVNDARAVLTNRAVRGLLIKKFGFSIADRHYVEPYFGRPVYNRRITGEIIVQNANLIPNAARNDFEHNSTRQAFLEALPRLTAQIDHWADQIQQTQRAREVLDDVTQSLVTLVDQLPKVGRDREHLLRLNAILLELDRRLRQQKGRLRKSAPDDFHRACELWQGANQIVTQALVSQKRTRKQLEEGALAALQQQEQARAAAKESKSESSDASLVELLDAYGFLENEDFRWVIGYLDTDVLRANLEPTVYRDVLAELRERLEDNR